MLNTLEKQLREALSGVLICANAGMFKEHEGEPWLERVRQAAARADESAADHPQGAAIRKLATELWDDDSCTVDHDANLAESEEDGAVWVQCWQLLDPDTLRENGITTEGMSADDEPMWSAPDGSVWTTGMARRAEAEGWDVFEAEDVRQIQRDDEAGKFATDDDAIYHVRRQASIQGATSFYAIALKLADIALPKKPILHEPERCPSNHWNDGDDWCEDCGVWLNG